MDRIARVLSSHDRKWNDTEKSRPSLFLLLKFLFLLGYFIIRYQFHKIATRFYLWNLTPGLCFWYDVISIEKNFILWDRSELYGSVVGFCIKNHKFQAPNRKQISNSNIQWLKPLRASPCLYFWILVIGIYLIFGFWYLGFQPITINRANLLRG